MDLGIDGRVAFVSGASKGIGRAIAAELVAEGAKVAVSSRSQERIEATASEIGATGFVWDTQDLDAVPELLDAVSDRLGGPVDILVTNTGGPPPGPDPLGFSREDWDAAYRSLVLAPLELIQHAMPGMRERGWGRVLNVASTSVREPIPSIMLSNSHRAALLAAFRTISREVAGDGVTLNTLLTGRIATERAFSNAGSREAAEAAAEAEVPTGRLGAPEEMAGAAAFLASDRAAYITGVALRVDGGLTRSV